MYQNNIMKPSFWNFRLFLAISLLLVVGCAVNGAESKESRAAKEQELIKVLQSASGNEEKAIACKKLSIYGGDAAVPVLEKLLGDPQLYSWARIGLEAIPGETANKAFRNQLDQLHGRPLVGVINSIGRRQDSAAVDSLAKKLSPSVPEVANAAAVAIGQIGGDKASKVLRQSLTEAAPLVRPAVGEGCIRCAELFLVQGKDADALKLYEAVLKAKLPKQRLLEATRGMILAKGSAGIPLLVEQLRSTDKAYFGIGLRTARELPGQKATEAIAKEMSKTTPERQSLLLLALADRGDKAALPTVMAEAKTGSKSLRITALGVLEKLGNASCIPVLMQAAVETDPELAQAGKASLVRLPGNDIDAELTAHLAKASGKQREVLIEVAGQRQIAAALPLAIAGLRDPNVGVRGAAVQTVGVLGSTHDVTELVNILPSTTSAQDRAELEAALLAITGRVGSQATPALTPLVKNPDSSVRIIGVHALASAGGSAALSQLCGLLNDKDESVRDETVRTLSSWPNTWPEDGEVAAPLLDLAKGSQKASYQVLALRGYLQYVQGDKKLKNADKLTCVDRALPMLKRPEEKRLAIAVVTGSPAPGMLKRLSDFTADPAVSEDACSAIISDTTAKGQGIPKDELKQALQIVVEKSAQDATRKKAEDRLSRL
jgi:HEAT repeat protein